MTREWFAGDDGIMHEHLRTLCDGVDSEEAICGVTIERDRVSAWQHGGTSPLNPCPACQASGPKFDPAADSVHDQELVQQIRDGLITEEEAGRLQAMRRGPRTHTVEVVDPDGFSFTLRSVTDEGLAELERLKPTARQLEAENRAAVAAAMSAYRRYLYGEPITADEAAQLIASCPICSECAHERNVDGAEHHWMGEGNAVFDVDDADDVAAFKESHPQLSSEQFAELIAGYECCKHCPAVRIWQWDADDYLDEDMDRDAEEEE